MNKFGLLLLKTLSDGKYHTYESLSKFFDVSKNQLLSELNNYALFLDFVCDNENICWKNPFTLLDKENITTQLRDSNHKFEINILPIVDSTNSYLKNLLKKN